MAFDFNSNPANSLALNPELAYDLRVYYAKIVGSHLEDIAEARKQDNYVIYLKAIKDLFIVVQHKFKKPTEKIGAYNSLLLKAVKIVNKYNMTFLGQDKDPQACVEIEAVLNNMEMFLYKEIDDANIFGSQRAVEGL